MLNRVLGPACLAWQFVLGGKRLVLGFEHPADHGAFEPPGTAERFEALLVLAQAAGGDAEKAAATDPDRDVQRAAWARLGQGAAAAKQDSTPRAGRRAPECEPEPEL